MRRAKEQWRYPRIVFNMRNSSDCICIRMLKPPFLVIGSIIQHITNTYITRYGIPDPWKHSIVHPILESGNPEQQLHNYLSQNHFLAPSQHGFRPRHIETALLSVTDSIQAATDRGEISLLCLIDLSKCFDVIDHELLLDKLTLHGVETPWFAAYMY